MARDTFNTTEMPVKSSVRHNELRKAGSARIVRKFSKPTKVGLSLSAFPNSMNATRMLSRIGHSPNRIVAAANGARNT